MCIVLYDVMFLPYDDDDVMVNDVITVSLQTPQHPKCAVNFSTDKKALNQLFFSLQVSDVAKYSHNEQHLITTKGME